MSLDVDTERPGDVRTTVLRIADELAAELHPHRTLPPASLHTHLDRDLGLDSLAMAELPVRLENAFGASLPSSLLSTAETPEDLLRAVVGVGTAKEAPAPVPTYDLSQTATETIPLEAGTLLNVLDWHRENHPDQVHIHLLGEDGPLDALTYADLKRGGEAVAQGLLAADLVPGESVALMLPTGRDYFEAFLGILLAGGVPVPIYPPGRPSQIEEHLRRHAQILTNAKATMLVTVPEARAVARLLRSSVETLRHVTTPTDLARSGGHESMPRVRPEDTALIQYTSGSTGDPKGVVLSHANVLANIRAMGQAAEVTPRDVFVSWLPLYHDMGLIGAWLGSLCLGMPVVIMSPLAFLARPARWLAAIDAYRGTITGAPNFAYELCLRKVTDTELQTLDLSTLRMALNGAEPVLAGTMERFAQRFAVCGLRPDALAPVYGLAEAAVGLAFPPPGRGLLIDAVDAERLRCDGQAIPALREGFDTLRIVASGQPLPGYEIRVVDHSGRELPDRTEGQIEFRGPSATAGYQRNSKATAALFHNGWLLTGDLGYVAGGDVFITGRSKDLIIRAGRNLHPEDLETTVGQLPGVRKGCVAAFATQDAETATERLIVVAETTETAESVREELRAQIAATTVNLLGTPPDEVVLAPKGTVLKTSSGKVRRAACADLYEKGAIGVHPRSVWWQVVRFSWRGVRPGFRRRRRTLSVFAYAAYVWLLFVAIGLPTLALVAIVPGRGPRRHVVRSATRALLRLSGTQLHIQGAIPTPTDTTFVVAANHASWLDSLVMAAWLPPSVTFVAGEVMGRQHVAGFLLRRIGSEFVERYDPGQGVADTARLGHSAETNSLVFFPEGGLDRAPGLRPFHLGAFVAAAEANRPIIPVAIRGTRSMLRPGHKLLRRGSVTVVIGDPVHPVESGGWAPCSLSARLVSLSFVSAESQTSRRHDTCGTRLRS
jgi:1-acyl-sn-glycerol-3-phosphate acyltransferase